jgi:UDP-N-acetylglucosamine 4,6-dehydratase
LHEVLLSEDEARQTLELEDMFVIEPMHSFWRNGAWRGGLRLNDGFRYASDNNTQWLTVQDLRELIPGREERSLISAT